MGQRENHLCDQQKGVKEINLAAESIANLVCKSCKPKMLILSIISITLFLEGSDGFLDDCPLDMHLHIDEELLIEVLRTFFGDLKFVKAITSTRQSRDYSRLIAEMRNVISSRRLQQAIERAEYELLNRNWNRFSRALFLRADDWNCRHAMQGRSYFYYLEAEAHRLMGDNQWAMNYIQHAMGVRQQCTGVSINELFKLHGLVVLQIVSHFNKNVDRLYGLKGSPNMPLLSSLRSVLDDETGPLDDMRSITLDRLFRTSPTIALEESSSHMSSDDLERIDPDQDDMSGQSVSEAAVDGILCEFTQKMSILGVSSKQFMATGNHYDEVIDQARVLDAVFAEELDARVVKIIESDAEQALKNANAMCRFLHESSGYFNFKESFIRYFRVELSRRSNQSCHSSVLTSMQRDLSAIKYIRQRRRGVSLGKMMELESRLVLRMIGCFHRRIKWAYELEGDENEQQLEAKHREFGACERKLPLSGLDE